MTGHHPMPERDRLTALETTIGNQRELMDIRHQQSCERFLELAERNRIQDQEHTSLVKELRAEFTGIKEGVWRFLKWFGGLLFVTALSVVLKAYGLI
jgi:hypothetical protein